MENWWDGNNPDGKDAQEEYELDMTEAQNLLKDIYGPVFIRALKIYMSHREEKGDSWKDQTCPIDYLRDKLVSEVEEFKEVIGEDAELDGVLDIINMCCMLASRLIKDRE